MKFRTLSLIAFVGTAALFSSCKKDSGTSSQIVGTWTESYNIDDINGNGLPDDAHNTVTGTPGTITFNANGTGVAVDDFGGTPISLPFTWTLNGNHLQTITATDTANVTIVELTSSKLTVEDNSDTEAEWDYFTR